MRGQSDLAGALAERLSRRQVLAGSLGGAVALGTGGCRTSLFGPPNILLIVVDTLRPDHLGCYGYERQTSPAIDRLAREGTVFARALSQSSWTLPAMGAMLSGRYPGTLGIEDMRSRLPDSIELLPSLLGQGRYDTGAVVAAPLCGPKRGFDRGFEHFDASNIKGHFEATSPGVTDAAIAYLDRPRTRPFFLWVHYFDPHFTYLDHAEHRFFTDPTYAGPVYPNQKIVDLFTLNERKELGPADFQRLRDLYDSEISYTDQQIGRLLDHLRESGRFEETLIILTSDHGEEFGEHGGLSHAYTLYQELVHVPLILKLAGGTRRPGRVEEPVATFDLTPTILEEAGFRAPEQAAGRSLLRRRPPTGSRTIFTETKQEKTDLCGGVSYPLKVVFDLKTREVFYFDLERDPGEMNPLQERANPGFSRLARDLGRWLRERRLATPASTELSSEEREMLRSLGYL